MMMPGNIIPFKTKKYDGPSSAAVKDGIKPPTLEQLASIAWEGGDTTNSKSKSTSNLIAVNNDAILNAASAMASHTNKDRQKKHTTKNKRRSFDFLTTLMRDEEMSTMRKSSTSLGPTTVPSSTKGLKPQKLSKATKPSKEIPSSQDVNKASRSRRVLTLSSPRSRKDPSKNRSASFDALSSLVDDSAQIHQSALPLSSQPPSSSRSSHDKKSKNRSASADFLANNFQHSETKLSESPVDSEQQFHQSTQSYYKNFDTTPPPLERGDYSMPTAPNTVPRPDPEYDEDYVNILNKAGRSKSFEASNEPPPFNNLQANHYPAVSSSPRRNHHSKNKRERRRRSPHPVRGFDDPSSKQQPNKTFGGEKHSKQRGLSSNTESNMNSSSDPLTSLGSLKIKDHGQQHQKGESEDSSDDASDDSSVKTVHTHDSLDGEKLQTAEQLRDLIEMMQAEFQKLRTAKVNAEMKAQTLETGIVSSQQEWDAEYLKLSEDVERWKRLAHKETMRYETSQMKVGRLEMENTKIKNEWSNVMKGKSEVEKRCELLERENRRLKNSLKQQHRSGSKKRAGSLDGFEEIMMVLNDSGSHGNGSQASPPSVAKASNRRLKSSRSLDGYEEMMTALSDRNDRSSHGNISKASPPSAATASIIGSPNRRSRRYGTPPSSNPPFESIVNPGSSRTPSYPQHPQTVHTRRPHHDRMRSSNDAPKAPASWHGGKKVKSIRKMPTFAPPLDNGGMDTNPNSNNAPLLRSSMKRISPSWRSADLRRQSSHSTASTIKSSESTLRDSILAKMMEGDDFDATCAKSLDGMVVLMEDMLEGKLGGNDGSDDGGSMDDCHRSGPL